MLPPAPPRYFDHRLLPRSHKKCAGNGKSPLRVSFNASNMSDSSWSRATADPERPPSFDEICSLRRVMTTPPATAVRGFPRKGPHTAPMRQRSVCDALSVLAINRIQKPSFLARFIRRASRLSQSRSGKMHATAFLLALKKGWIHHNQPRNALGSAPTPSPVKAIDVPIYSLPGNSRGHSCGSLQAARIQSRVIKHEAHSTQSFDASPRQASPPQTLALTVSLGERADIIKARTDKL